MSCFNVSSFQVYTSIYFTAYLYMNTKLILISAFLLQSICSYSEKPPGLFFVFFWKCDPLSPNQWEMSHLFNVLLVSPFIILLLVYLSKWSNPWVNKLWFNLSNISSSPDVAQDTWTSSNYTFCMAIFSISYPTFRGSICNLDCNIY